MKFLIMGLLIGVILNFIPLFMPDKAVEIFPEWHASLQSIENTEKSSNASISSIILTPVVTDEYAYIFTGNGGLQKKINIKDSLVSFSKNGKYYVKYEKIGNAVELYDTSGGKYWHLQSADYPYISPDAKIILLMNGDHSKINVLNINAVACGVKEISSMLCTVISFPGNSGFSGIGFLNGNYFILNNKGDVVSKGAEKDFIIKGISISDNGSYFTVHYGNNKGDFIKTVNSDNDTYTIPLKHIHLTKTALLTADNGKSAVIDEDRIILCLGKKIISEINIPAKSPGLSSISFSGNLYSASYKGVEKAYFLIFEEDGTVVFNREFPYEDFIESNMYGNLTVIRGSGNLYAYRSE